MGGGSHGTYYEPTEINGLHHCCKFYVICLLYWFFKVALFKKRETNDNIQHKIKLSIIRGFTCMPVAFIMVSSCFIRHQRWSEMLTVVISDFFLIPQNCSIADYWYFEILRSIEPG